MATNFPTSVDAFTNPTANDSLNSPSHATQHINSNDAIEAIENAIISPATYPDQLVNGTTATVRPLPFAIAAGQVTLTASATITFPANRFTQAPLTTANGISTNSTITSVTFGNASTTSVTAYAWTGTTASSTSRNINYIAIQMTSAAAAG